MYNKKKKHVDNRKPHYHRTEEGGGENVSDVKEGQVNKSEKPVTENNKQETVTATNQNSNKGQESANKQKSSNRSRRNYYRNKNKNYNKNKNSNQNPENEQTQGQNKDNKNQNKNNKKNQNFNRNRPKQNDKKENIKAENADNYTGLENKKEKEKSFEDNPICPICNSVIRNTTTAVAHRETEKPCHFDCVLKLLRQENRDKLNGKHRKVYYIGGGSFAIVKEKFDKRGRFRSYSVIERINYESEEDK